MEPTRAKMPGVNGAPETIPLSQVQPTPRKVKVSVSAPDADGRVVTAITRVWWPGDGRRCRLCPRPECSEDGDDACLVQVEGAVSPGELPLFSTLGRPRHRE